MEVVGDLDIVCKFCSRFIICLVTDLKHPGILHFVKKIMNL